MISEPNKKRTSIRQRPSIRLKRKKLEKQLKFVVTFILVHSGTKSTMLSVKYLVMQQIQVFHRQQIKEVHMCRHISFMMKLFRKQTSHINSFHPSVSHYRRSHAPLRRCLPPGGIKCTLFNENRQNPVSTDSYRRIFNKMNISFTKLGEEKSASRANSASTMKVLIVKQS